ncbi:MAG: AraC family transcriptional regulator [Oscillospiraceae bacterium]|nr:AraC family transcriptional regulator [Oscillospiraceae bacterium]
MEWLTGIRSAIDFIENNLENDISVQDVADKVFISPIFLQRGFSLMTGFSIGEYIRNRRLYQAALDLVNTEDLVIVIAYRYCYETPESFTKAFSRFHGVTPSQVRNSTPFKPFLPIKINLTVQGGNNMDYKITSKAGFKVIGFQKVFDSETSYAEIPKFWDEVCGKYANNVWAGNAPANAFEKAVANNNIGEYGICIDDIGGSKFRYLIAGKYEGGEVPGGMEVFEFPVGDWAVFDIFGPCPGALQSVNTKIFTEWLPGNPEYEISGNANVEWYDCMSKPNDKDYHSAIWIPVKKK